MSSYMMITGSGKILRGMTREQCVNRLRQATRDGDRACSLHPERADSADILAARDDIPAIESEAGYRGMTEAQCDRALRRMGRPMLGASKRVPLRASVDQTTLDAIEADRGRRESVGQVIDRWARERAGAGQ